MKILIGMTRSDTTISGSYKHICQIGECFKTKGVDVTYVLGGRFGPAITELKSNGHKVITLNFLDREIRPFRDFISIIHLIWIILRENPDVCSWHTAKIGALGRIASFLTFKRSYYVPHGVPFVNTPENSGFKKYEKLEKLLSYLPSKIIAVCEFDKNEYLRIGVSENKVISILNGMNGITLAKDSSSKTEPIKFITAARFESQKDFKSLSEACKLLVERGQIFSLEIYGNGTKEVEVKNTFNHLPDGLVVFKDVVSNFAEKISKSDVFILSSFWEGLPRSIIEAMACEKAIIATDVGGVSELIEHEVNGYLVPIRSPEKIYSSMLSYIQCNDLVIEHGRKSLQIYKKSFTLDKMLETYCDVYGVSSRKGLV